MNTSKYAGIEPIQSFEISPDTLSFTQGKDAKNTKIKQFLCVRDFVPKTNLYQTILLENRSHDRMLEKTLSNLSVRQLKYSNSLDLTARTFRTMQERKQKKWKREDEMRLSSMNLPLFHVTDDRPSSADVMYHMPEYGTKPRKPPKRKSKAATKLPKMPYNIRREQTEIITYKGKTCMTRLPEVVEVDQDALKHYDQYRGKKFLYKGVAKKDNRFDQLQGLLSPAKLRDIETAPSGNTLSKSRLSKYSSQVNDEFGQPDLPMSAPNANMAYSRWMITAPESNSDTDSQDCSRKEVRFSDHVKRSDQIVEHFKTKDVKKLAMTLAKDKSQTGKDDQEVDGKTFVPGVNVYFTKNKE